jgi:hypothetical protein
MKSDFQIRLFEMEVDPPQQVWERLSASLDEINADNHIASKIYNTESIPVSDTWEKIKEALTISEIAAPEKKAIVINFKKLAIAAISIGIIFSVWLLFFNTQQKNSDLAETKTLPVKEEKNITEKSEPIPSPSITENFNKGEKSQPIVSNKKNQNKKSGYITQTSFAKNLNELPPAATADNNQIAKLNDKPGEKFFDQPIDDLSIVATSENYMTMVNANGRIVKIPAHLAYLAPRLQDKPLTEDYHEIMFGEGAFWNEKLSEWRQQLANSPVSSGDIFSTMIDLLKNVQGK